MTDEEVIKAVRTIRYSSQTDRNARKAPSMHALAQAAEVDRMTVYNVASTGKMSLETRDKLLSVLSSSWDRYWTCRTGG